MRRFFISSSCSAIIFSSQASYRTKEGLQPTEILTESQLRKLQARIHFPTTFGAFNNREQKTLCCARREETQEKKRVICKNAFDRLKKQLDFLRPPMFAPERAKKAIIKRLFQLLFLTARCLLLGKCFCCLFFKPLPESSRETG